MAKLIERANICSIHNFEDIIGYNIRVFFVVTFFWNLFNELKKKKRKVQAILLLNKKFLVNILLSYF